MDAILSSQDLNGILSILNNCYGPFSHPVVLINRLNGPVDMSRHIGHVLQNFSGSNPLFKLITTTIKAHSHRVGDGR